MISFGYAVNNFVIRVGVFSSCISLGLHLYVLRSKFLSLSGVGLTSFLSLKILIFHPESIHACINSL